MSALNRKTVPVLEENVPALPAWRVIWNMLRFRPWLWLIDLVSVALFRASWQLVPALAMQAFFDMLTGEAQVTFGVWAIVAFFVAAWLAQVAFGINPAEFRALVEEFTGDVRIINTPLEIDFFMAAAPAPAAAGLPIRGILFNRS